MRARRVVGEPGGDRPVTSPYAPLLLEWEEALGRRPAWPIRSRCGRPSSRAGPAGRPALVAPLPWSAQECRERWERGAPLIAESAPELPREPIEEMVGPVMEQMARKRRPTARLPFSASRRRGTAGRWDRVICCPPRGRRARRRARSGSGWAARCRASSPSRVSAPRSRPTSARVGRCRRASGSPVAAPGAAVAPAYGDLVEDGRRRLSCHLCGGAWIAPRLRCPFCENWESRDLVRLVGEGAEEGYFIEACRACHGYIKGVDRRQRWNAGSPLVEDWGRPIWTSTPRARATGAARPRSCSWRLRSDGAGDMTRALGVNAVLYDVALTAYIVAMAAALAHLVRRREGFWRFALVPPRRAGSSTPWRMVVRGIELGRLPILTLPEVDVGGDLGGGALELGWSASTASARSGPSCCRSWWHWGWCCPPGCGLSRWSRPSAARGSGCTWPWRCSGWPRSCSTSRAALMYLLQERQLKTKRPSAVYYRLPPLETLDRLSHRTLTLGFPFLTAGLVLGVLWARGGVGQRAHVGSARALLHPHVAGLRGDAGGPDHGPLARPAGRLLRHRGLRPAPAHPVRGRASSTGRHGA